MCRAGLHVLTVPPVCISLLVISGVLLHVITVPPVSNLLYVIISGVFIARVHFAKVPNPNATCQNLVALRQVLRCLGVLFRQARRARPASEVSYASEASDEP